MVNGIIALVRWRALLAAPSRRGRTALWASQGAIRSECAKRAPAMIATMAPSNGQRVSRMSSLWIFWTVLKPISGSSSPQLTMAVSAASRPARTISRRWDASTAISDFLHVGSSQQTLRQEDHRDGENRESGDIFVVGREIGRPQRL